MARFGSGIHVLDVRTGSVRRLKRTTELDDAPVWSPDGKAIVFQRRVTSTNWDLYRINPTGRGVRRLTRDALQQVNPAWSPDGSRLAFAEQQKTGNWAISTMKIDGSDRRLLTDARISSQNPSWSPDGKKIALVLQDGLRDAIALIDAGGGRPVRISPRPLSRLPIRPGPRTARGSPSRQSGSRGHHPVCDPCASAGRRRRQRLREELPGGATPIRRDHPRIRPRPYSTRSSSSHSTWSSTGRSSASGVSFIVSRSSTCNRHLSPSHFL